MNQESFWLLAELIASHPEGHIFGRLRLQKTVYLLQRAGFPSNFLFSLFFDGPYSDGLFSDLKLLKEWGVVRETEKRDEAGEPEFLLQVVQTTPPQGIDGFRDKIALLAAADPMVLDLAATYEGFRQLGSDHVDALQSLRRKKRSKWTPAREAAAVGLLEALGLPTTEHATA
jgi:uncharacterized protein YwgA